MANLKDSERPTPQGLKKLREKPALDRIIRKAYLSAWSLLLTFAWPALGANFFEFKERGGTDTAGPHGQVLVRGVHTGCLLATNDAEIGKIGPSPSGCGENRLILRSRPRLGIAKVLVLRLISTPRTKTCPWGPRCLSRFSLATQAAGKLITGSRGPADYTGTIAGDKTPAYQSPPTARMSFFAVCKNLIHS